MFKRVFNLLLCACLVTATCCVTGCWGTGAGEVIQGKAGNDRFAESGDTDEHGNNAPGGLGTLN